MHSKVSTAPFTNFSKSMALRALFCWLALLPQIALLFVSKSWNSLLLILFCVLGTALSEADKIIGKSDRNVALAHSLLAGTLSGFFLPEGYPAASALLISFIFMFASRKAFGPPGVSWLNPVALTVIAAWFAGRTAFGGFILSGADLLVKNPSMALIDGASLSNGADEMITAFLNDSVFRLFNVSIPNGYVSLFWDNHASIPAFRFTFMTLLASIFLFAFDIKKPEVPLFSLLIYFELVHFLSPLITGAPPMGGDMLLAMLSSGALFSAFFVLQWPGTSPLTIWGKVIYSILCGSFAFAFCGTGTSPVGAALTILFANLTAPALQYLESKNARKKISALVAEKLGEAEQ